jgi:hypothetical protein
MLLPADKNEPIEKNKKAASITFGSSLFEDE